MAQISTGSSALAAAWGTATTVAQTTTGIFQVVGDTMAMANNYVSKHLEQQKIAHHGETAMFKRDLMDRLKMQDAQRRKAVVEFRNADKLNEELFQDAEKFIDDLYSEFDKPKAATA